MHKKKNKTMKSRAELLAEIEENRLESKEIEIDLEALSISETCAPDGHDPYNHPGQRKGIPDDADISARRREIFLRSR